jgi:hypothetical protein
MEVAMLKFFSIFALLVALGTASANAQQREAMLQRLKVPGSDFDIIIVRATPGSPSVLQHGLPDPLIVNFAGGALAMAFDVEADKSFNDILLAPNCTVHMNHKSRRDSNPVAVYVVPKAETTASPAH